MVTLISLYITLSSLGIREILKSIITTTELIHQRLVQTFSKVAWQFKSYSVTNIFTAELIAADFNITNTLVTGELLEVLTRPFDEQPENAGYENPPQPGEVVRATFCGT